MSTSYHDDRIKLTLVLHSGVVEDSKAYLLKELNKFPIAYIIGGPKDIAYNNVSLSDLLSFSALFSIFTARPKLTVAG
jgi:hypothetical protein